MKGEQLMISDDLLVEATLEAGVILARYLHVYAPQVEKGVTAATLHGRLRLLFGELIFSKFHRAVASLVNLVTHDHDL
jgi:hypothetical protein